MTEKVITNPFTPRPKKFKGTKRGDEYYHTKKAYLKFIETGKDENGKAIGTIDVEEIETKTKIQDLINSHADEAGLQNIIKKYILTQDTSLFNARNPLPNGDYTQDIKKPEDILKTLPKEITKGRKVEELLKNLSKEDIKDFIDAIKKVEEKGDTVNEKE